MDTAQQFWVKFWAMFQTFIDKNVLYEEFK